MSNDLIKAFSNEPVTINEDIISMKKGYNKKTKKITARATTSDGRTFIKTLSHSGIYEESMVTIPSFSSKKERNEHIYSLHTSGYTQDEIADMLDISQSTVHNVLAKR